MAPSKRTVVLAVMLFALSAGSAFAQDVNETNESTNATDNDTGNETENITPVNGSDGANNTSDANATNETPVVLDEETATICHIPPGDPEAAHTIEVGAPALKAHLAHGDHRGSCEDGPEPTQVQRAIENGSIDAEVNVTEDGTTDEVHSGPVVVREIDVQRSRELRIAFVAQAEEPPSEAIAAHPCEEGAVLLFRIDRGLLEAAPVTSTPGPLEETNESPPSAGGLQVTYDNETDNGTNGSLNDTNATSNETNVSDNASDNDTELPTAEQPDTMDVDIVTNVFVTVDALSAPDAGEIEDAAEVEAGEQPEFIVVDGDFEVLVLVALDDVCEPREGTIVTQSAAEAPAATSGFGPMLLAAALVAAVVIWGTRSRDEP